MVDFERKSGKDGQEKPARPALVIQNDLLNNAGHKRTIVIPGTVQVFRDPGKDAFPLRVAVGMVGGQDTDLLMDQIRTIPNSRFLQATAVATLSGEVMKRVEQALRLILY